MTENMQRLNDILQPVGPPRVVEDVYTDDQHKRILQVIKGNGPGRRSLRTTSPPWRS